MIDLLGNTITHIPEHIIRDRTRIGNDGFTQFVLVFEGGEFRVYNYEYSEYYDLSEDERNRYDDCANYFYDFSLCLDTTTLAYTRLDIDGERGRTRDELIAYAREHLTDGPRDIEERIFKFFNNNIEKLGTKVYQYYK